MYQRVNRDPGDRKPIGTCYDQKKRQWDAIETGISELDNMFGSSGCANSLINYSCVLYKGPCVYDCTCIHVTICTAGQDGIY